MLTRLKKIIELSKPRLIAFGLAVGFNVTLAGLVCGTFAWYSYATRAGFNDFYHGTTVTDAGFLRIGLVSVHRLSDCSKYNLEMDDSFNMATHYYIYWSSSNNLSAESINYVVNANGYGTTKIDPTTTGSDDALNTYGFHLYRNPTVNDGYKIKPDYYAEKKSSVLIPFIFKVSESEGNGFSYSKVYLSDYSLSTSSDDGTGGEIHNAVRFHIVNPMQSVIVAPSYLDDGQNDVAGILDLDGDGFYDYDKATNSEVVYGEPDGDYSYKSEPTLENGTIPQSEITSFNSNHKKDVYALDEDTFVSKKVSYYGMSRLTSRQFPIATPDDRFNGLSYGEINIYLEGWDRHLTNAEESSAFNLDLSFSA